MIVSREYLILETEKGLFKKFKKLGKVALKEACTNGDFSTKVPLPKYDYENNTSSIHKVQQQLKEWYKSKGIQTGSTEAGTPYDLQNVFWTTYKKLGDD